VHSNAKDDKFHVAFFYLQEAVGASNGQYWRTMTMLRDKLKKFNCQWFGYSKPLSAIPAYSGQVMKPGLLILADEVFQLPD